MTFKQWLKKKGACEEALKWVKKNNIMSAEEAWRRCPIPRWLSWLADVLFGDSNIDDLISRYAAASGRNDIDTIACDNIRKNFIVPDNYVIQMAMKLDIIEDAIQEPNFTFSTQYD